jgi:hypothetical protein
MAFTTNGKNDLLDNFSITHAALFDGDPESGGAEPVGGSYARKAITWGAAAAGSRAATGTYVFDIPNGFTVRWAGFYTALSGGTLLAKADVTDKAYTADGTYTLTAITASLT